MLTVREALDAILNAVEPLPARAMPLAECLGLVLAEDVFADRDSPPFDKSLMDGYAVRLADLSSGKAVLTLVEEITAGRVPKKTIGPGETARIMTGAPVPQAAEAVVPVELTSIAGNGSVEIAATPSFGWNILRRGASFKAGDCLLKAGRRLRGQELGALAEIGRARVTVHPAPSVAVLATGDELVPVDETPGPGQIRNSNETMLVAQVRQAGAVPVPLGIARDTRESLRDRIAEGLKHNVLLLSGGVSAGMLDLVPSVLRDLGVREIFHKVRVKPGQPLWFGEFSPPPTPHSPLPCFIFGLPGNPVSSMVCCELFARTAIRRLMGEPNPEPAAVRARLTREFTHSGGRPTYHPATLAFPQDGPQVTAVPWIGSADLAATVEANAMAVFPAGEATYPAGSTIEVIPW